MHTNKKEGGREGGSERGSESVPFGFVFIRVDSWMVLVLKSRETGPIWSVSERIVAHEKDRCSPLHRSYGLPDRQTGNHSRAGAIGWAN